MPHTLTDGQLRSFENILDYCNSDKLGMRLLQGPAGVGKTYLAGELLKDLSTVFTHKISVCAPTHKAVKVLANQVDVKIPRTDFGTIHSDLALTERIDGYGRVRYIPDKFRTPPLLAKNILFLDEGSMLDDSIYNYLEYYIKNNMRIVFIADGAQIPPINSTSTRILTSDYQQKYNVEVLNLNEIVRQQLGHPIIEEAFKIRNHLHDYKLPISNQSISNSSGSISHFNEKSDSDTIELMELFYKYFTSSDFNSNPDYAKVIVWQNKVANAYNSIIRPFIFNNDLNKIMKDEKLILNAAILRKIQGTSKERMVLRNNDEVFVKGFDIDYKVIKYGQQSLKVKYYRCGVRRMDPHNTFTDEIINIIHEDSDKEYQNAVASLRGAALKLKQGTKYAKIAWVKYYTFQKHFANVGYNYCITAHKSQGSTYKNTIVLYNDMLENKNVYERNRIIYTAYTRASKNLTLFH